MKKPFAPVLAAIALAGSFSCATGPVTTLLASAQSNHHDSIVPTPQSASVDRADSTTVFANGSLSRGNPSYEEYDLFAQGGLLQSWRRPAGKTLFDGHIALSGWYGNIKLHDTGSALNPQFIPSAADPFAFYGLSAQAGEALGYRVIPELVFNLGLRAGVSYETGPYRQFRALATTQSTLVKDVCPSGWSGDCGFDAALTWSISQDLDIRTGLFLGFSFNDLPFFFASRSKSADGLLNQPSLAIRYKEFYAATSFDWYIFNNISVGYVFR